jgi:amino acid adenylation domain-containing protein
MTLPKREDNGEDEAAPAHIAHVPDLIAARAAERPDALALTSDVGVLTYGALDAQANRMAHHLRSLGVDVGDAVGLCVPRSLEMVVGALGVLKAGGAYIPMDPAYPAERLAFMLDDAQAPAVITTASLAQALPLGNRTLVTVESPQVTAQPASAPMVHTDESDLAYIVYTSGSTGTPKGVEITHRGLTNLVAWHVHAFSVSTADRASHLSGLGFDASVWELWPYLTVGANVSLVDGRTRNSPELLREWLLSEKITIGFVPTPLAEQLLAARTPWPRTTALRIMLTGGDMLHTYPPAGLPFQLVNNYGPSECTVVATSGVILPTAAPTAPPSIGRAIANTRIHLLDEHQRSVPFGTLGEIYIEGLGVARGYRNQPGLTAERFVPSPFGGDPARRLYRTGDVARMLPDGQIAFLGRTDDQIKIRGYRVEPGEISSVLNRHRGVRASVAVTRGDAPGQKRLVAYLVADADAGLTHTGLREFLRASLPDYMLPAAFVRIDAFPLTAHGKIDRAALPVPNADNTLQDEVVDAPCTDTERQVADILGELLKLKAIGLDDNFFLLGGHSLLGAQLIARLREVFGVQISLRTLFEAATVAALSAEVDRCIERRGREAVKFPSSAFPGR